MPSARTRLPRPMPRLARLLLLCAIAVAGLGLGACGDKEDLRTVGETEGLYVDVGGLRYQVQISRYLNPADVEDEGYLVGLPEGVRPDDDETWFGVFMRVQNTSEETHESAREITIEDTQGKVYRPVPLSEVNNFAYRSRPLRPGNIEPHPDSAAGNGPIQGSLLLYRLTYDTLQNRPLELHIVSPENSEEVGIIDLDV